MFSPIAFLALSLLAVPDTLNAHQTDEDRAPEVQMNSGAREREVPAEILTIQPDVPRGPNEILASYEGEMASITSRISDELGEIVEAVGSGQLSIRQGESLARERYQMATMQFELLSAWHAILQHAVDEARAVPTPPEPLPLSGQAWVRCRFPATT